MRAPRYRFPDEVRSTTRAMASRMVHDGTIARTPEELDAWIAREPGVREPLERGGYGTAFTAHDLLPLLHVFVEKAGGPAPHADEPAPSSSGGRRVVGLVVVLVAALLLAVLAIGALT
jgi:hypothetical protein